MAVAAVVLATPAHAQGYGDLYDFQVGDVPVAGGIATDSLDNDYGTLNGSSAHSTRPQFSKLPPEEPS